MYTCIRQFKVDYNLIHEYLIAIGFKFKYERIFLVESISNSQFVIRLKFPRVSETYPVYVTHREWEKFLNWRNEQKTT